MSQERDRTLAVLSGGTEAVPPGFLSRLEQSTHDAYRSQARAGRTRRRVFGACLAVAALVPLAWLFERPEAPRITAEQVRPIAPRTPTAKAAPGAVPRDTKEPSSSVEPPEPAPVKRPLPSAKPRPPALGEELAILAQARRALQNGDPGQALSVLDRHGGDLKAGQLRLEAEVLRLEALAELGATREVSRRAQQFIDQNPNSPLADRVRGFVDQ